jgi:hypothetical protein
MRNGTVSQESADGMETGPIKPEPDDEVIAYTAHRQLVILAGNCARLEQQRLEHQLKLENGRTPRPG